MECILSSHSPLTSSLGATLRAIRPSINMAIPRPGVCLPRPSERQCLAGVPSLKSLSHVFPRLPGEPCCIASGYWLLFQTPRFAMPLVPRPTPCFGVYNPPLPGPPTHPNYVLSCFLRVCNFRVSVLWPLPCGVWLSPLHHIPAGRRSASLPRVTLRWRATHRTAPCWSPGVWTGLLRCGGGGGRSLGCVDGFLG